jgi:hypothetical protein
LNLKAFVSGFYQNLLQFAKLWHVSSNLRLAAICDYCRDLCPQQMAGWLAGWLDGRAHHVMQAALLSGLSEPRHML